MFYACHHVYFRRHFDDLSGGQDHAMTCFQRQPMFVALERSDTLLSRLPLFGADLRNAIQHSYEGERHTHTHTLTRTHTHTTVS
jgi:hypothetical protein